MNGFVVSGLVKRRADLAGEIERTHEALRKMLLDLERLRRDCGRLDCRGCARALEQFQTVEKVLRAEPRLHRLIVLSQNPGTAFIA